MSDRVVIRVSPEAFEALRKLASDRSIEIGEAADLAVKTAKSRLDALAKYADKGGAPKKPRAKKPKGEKKARVKKAAKKAPKAKKARRTRQKAAKGQKKARASSKAKK